MLDWFAVLYAPVGRYFRSRRLRRFVCRLRVEPSTTVLDLGGGESYWRWCDVRPQITVVNLTERDLRRERLPWVRADGRQLPFADHSFDVVHCNSVLEHLPDESSRRAMAREISRVGRAYWVQTPNRWFFIDAHTLTPGFHFLPKCWQVRLARNFTVWGWLQRPTVEQARGFIENIELLTTEDLQRLFPEAMIERERFLSLTKSVTALRNR